MTFFGQRIFASSTHTAVYNIPYSVHLPNTLRKAEALFSISPLDAVQVYSPVWSTVTFSTVSVLDSTREFHSFFLWGFVWVSREPFTEVWHKKGHIRNRRLRTYRPDPPRRSQTHPVTFARWPGAEINWRIPESRKSGRCARATGSETLHSWYICLSVNEADLKCSSNITEKESRRAWGTDQRLTGVRPVEFDAHVELGLSRAAEHQPLPHRKLDIRGGQGELMDFVSCGKGREDTGVSQRPIVLLRLQTRPHQSPFHFKFDKTNLWLTQLIFFSLNHFSVLPTTATM